LDGAVYFGKSGIEKLLLDYLELDPSARKRLQNEENEQTSWRRRLEREGVLRTIQHLMGEHPTLTIGSLLGSAAFIGLQAFAALGTWRALADRTLPLNSRLMFALLGLFPIYLFFASQVGWAMPSRFHAPAEFALCLLASVGLRSIRPNFTFQNSLTR
jgi:hypothetical protein